jgi:HlyD family secretion protein
MPYRPIRSRARWFWFGAAGLAIATGFWKLTTEQARRDRKQWLEQLPRVAVKRSMLTVGLIVPGEVVSRRSTIIECGLEALPGASGGRAGGSSTILTLMAEGATVQANDVLCELDASAYEELVRLQRVTLESARASKLKAEFDLQAAKIALHEYLDGTKHQQEDSYRGQIALAESDLQRQTDRLAWAVQMNSQGFYSNALLTGERISLMRAKLTLNQIQGQYHKFIRYGSLISKRSFENRVAVAETSLDFQRIQLQRAEERMAKYERQVALCTIRAPHAGTLVYTNDRGQPAKIDLGMSVRQRQPLFNIPDLTQMEVKVLLNESVVDRVREGMPAHIRLEPLPGPMLRGRIIAIAPLSFVMRGGYDFRNYIARIALDSTPQGLMPGMTAEAEILTAQRPSALVVPPNAVALVDGQRICYVANGPTFVRRPVKVGQMNEANIEVTEGLKEGEEVLADVTKLERKPTSWLAGALPASWGQGPDTGLAANN